MTNQELRLLVTVREAAEALAISERTLWTLTNAGAIKAVRIGRAVRYARSDLQGYIDRMRREPLQSKASEWSI